MWEYYMKKVLHLSQEKLIEKFHEEKIIFVFNYIKTRKDHLDPHLRKIIHFFGRKLSFFSNKGYNVSNIQLAERNKLYQEYQKIAHKINTFFKNEVSNVGRNEKSHVINNASSILCT